MRFFHGEYFLLFLELFESFNDVVGARGGDFVVFLMFDDLVDVGHFVGEVTFDFIFFWPLHLSLIGAGSGTVLVEGRVVIEVVTSFGLV